MASTGAGTPAPADGGPPAAPPEPEAPRGLRDRPLGKLLLLVLVLAAAALVANTCGSQDQNVTQEEAIEIATDEASFEPCDESGCVIVRYIQRGIPVAGFWAVGLAEDLGEGGQPTRVENFLVNATTGDVTRA